jgi:hypothetical protein
MDAWASQSLAYTCNSVCRFDREDRFFIRATAGADVEAPWPSKDREAEPSWYAVQNRLTLFFVCHNAMTFALLTEQQREAPKRGRPTKDQTSQAIVVSPDRAKPKPKQVFGYIFC